jgi:hypothetical protein
MTPAVKIAMVSKTWLTEPSELTLCGVPMGNK